MRDLIRRGRNASRMLCALVAFVQLYAGSVASLSHTDGPRQPSHSLLMTHGHCPRQPVGDVECVPCALQASLVSPGLESTTTMAAGEPAGRELPQSERLAPISLLATHFGRGPPTA